jgi:hypothetical protein
MNGTLEGTGLSIVEVATYYPGTRWISASLEVDSS